MFCPKIKNCDFLLSGKLVPVFLSNLEFLNNAPVLLLAKRESLSLYHEQDYFRHDLLDLGARRYSVFPHV